MPIFLLDRCAIFLITAAVVAVAAFIREAMRDDRSGWMGFYCVLGVLLAVVSVSYANATGERHHRLVTMQADLRHYCAKNLCVVKSIDPDNQTADLLLSAGCEENPPLFQVNGKWEPSLAGPTGDCLPPLP